MRSLCATMSCRSRRCPSDREVVLPVEPRARLGADHRARRARGLAGRRGRARARGGRAAARRLGRRRGARGRRRGGRARARGSCFRWGDSRVEWTLDDASRRHPLRRRPSARARRRVVGPAHGARCSARRLAVPGLTRARGRRRGVRRARRPDAPRGHALAVAAPEPSPPRGSPASCRSPARRSPSTSPRSSAPGSSSPAARGARRATGSRPSRSARRWRGWRRSARAGTARSRAAQRAGAASLTTRPPASSRRARAGAIGKTACGVPAAAHTTS